MNGKKLTNAEAAAGMKDHGSISQEKQETILKRAWQNPEIVENARRGLIEPLPLDEFGAPMSFSPTLKKAGEAFSRIVEEIEPNYEVMDKMLIWTIFLGQVEEGQENV